MRFEQLADWLQWQESLHTKHIDLGLERVQQVAQRLFDRTSFPTIITVAGTNGKGSVCAFLSSIYAAAGFRTGLYSSPHIHRYNERIRIDNEEVSDALICESFERIDQARGEISLTYFEFGTLAAMDIFSRQSLDVVILEVGLGGRLDAVNILDPDLSVITSIDLDHQDWLGNDRETIAIEKLGITRPDIPAVVGEIDLPANVIPYCEQRQVPVFRVKHEYAFFRGEDSWRFETTDKQYDALPFPALNGEHQLVNASSAIMATHLLAKKLPLSMAAIRHGLLDVKLKGRLQRLTYRGRDLILDVAHNPQSTNALARGLRNLPEGEYHALVGMLEDKAIEESLEPMKSRIKHWNLIDLEPPRGASRQRLEVAMKQIGVVDSYCSHDDMSAALEYFVAHSQVNDVLVIFGSFYTVSDALKLVVD